MLGTQGQKTDAPLDQRARYFETGHAFEHLQERLLVDAAQRLGRRAAEQDFRSFDGPAVLLLAVHHASHLAGQRLLQSAQMRRLAVSGDETLDRLAVEHREYLDVALGVLIAHVEPELV